MGDVDMYTLVSCKARRVDIYLLELEETFILVPRREVFREESRMW